MYFFLFYGIKVLGSLSLGLGLVHEPRPAQGMAVQGGSYLEGAFCFWLKLGLHPDLGMVDQRGLGAGLDLELLPASGMADQGVDTDCPLCSLVCRTRRQLGVHLGAHHQGISRTEM